MSTIPVCLQLGKFGPSKASLLLQPTFYSRPESSFVQVTIMLEELGVEYDAWLINIMKGDQFTSGFVAANPNSKIPAMYDYGISPDQPVRVFETGSILMYLSEKHGGKFMPKVPVFHFMHVE